MVCVCVCVCVCVHVCTLFSHGQGRSWALSSECKTDQAGFAEFYLHDIAKKNMIWLLML